VFTAEQLSGVRAMITAGGNAAAGGRHGYTAVVARHRLLRHRL
jgi:hypothetical protein